MKGILNLRIYTPNGLFVEEVITKVTVTGNEGCYTILPKHIDYVSSFEDGTLCFTRQNGEKAFVGVGQGILIKCGREVQISTFNAIAGGDTTKTLREAVKDNFDEKKTSVDVEKKLKTSLRSMEFELFKKIGITSFPRPQERRTKL
jgi:F-type H+-transporting ATPase subunit epsilon